MYVSRRTPRFVSTDISQQLTMIDTCREHLKNALAFMRLCFIIWPRNISIFFPQLSRVTEINKSPMPKIPIMYFPLPEIIRKSTQYAHTRLIRLQFVFCLRIPWVHIRLQWPFSPQDLTDCFPVKGMKFPTGQINGLHSDITANVTDPFHEELQARDISTSRAFTLSVSHFVCEPKDLFRYRLYKT